MPTIYKNGIEYGGATTGNGVVELTQIQYDALTPAEKTNGTIYFVTDADLYPVDSCVYEDGNGDISITRNITAGGDVTDGDGNMLSTLADNLSMFGKVLWTGTWSSGSKTISGLGDFLVYLFYEDAGNAMIGFHNEAGHIRAFGLTGGAAGNQYAQTAGLAYSNGEYTFQYCNQVTHTVSGNHSDATSRSITKIIGLIPKIS